MNLQVYYIHSFSRSAAYSTGRKQSGSSTGQVNFNTDVRSSLNREMSFYP